MKISDLDPANIRPEVARHLSIMYCRHCFDLLGSGWVKNSYSSAALGVEGHVFNMNVAAPLSVGKGYEPIDWQKDFKSGFRWNEKVWFKDQDLTEKPGKDVKVPWELARLQHLPQLAIFTLVDDSLKAQNLQEFKWQILDFLANNPPRMGINWTCNMDVSIRAANMLLAYDLFTQIDDDGFLDHSFKQNFANAIYEHGLHIINNLEYSENLSSNHYLSNIAGLLFVAAYLDSLHETDRWLAFSLQELISEVSKQFYEDGGNYESTTCYHRLSAEMVVFASAIALGLGPDKIAALENASVGRWRITPALKPLKRQEYFIDAAKKQLFLPQWYVDRIYKMGRFTFDITKPGGEVAQFGDNDSGRFFRLSPSGELLTNRQAVEKYLNLAKFSSNNELFWDENSLDHSGLVSACAGLFAGRAFSRDSLPALERSLIRSMARRTLTVKDKGYTTAKTFAGAAEPLEFRRNLRYEFPSAVGELQLITYPDSGIYICKNAGFYLAICAAPNGPCGLGGHIHYDKLNFELQVNGQDLVKDPGTYIYSALPGKRNLFRSAAAHAVPVVAEAAPKATGIFSPLEPWSCSVISLEERRLCFLAEYKKIRIMRRFEIGDNYLLISDSCNYQFTYGKFNFYSQGYGKISSTSNC